LISHSAGRGEQGRVQGAAGALESVGRAVGPVWGNSALQHFGEGSAYGAAAVLLVGAAAGISRYRPPERDTVVVAETSAPGTEPLSG
jgi:hypothetical protein